MSRSLAVLPLALLLSFAPGLARAQEKAEAPKAEEPVAKGLKSRVFEVKNRSPRDLRVSIGLLSSGAPGSAMQWSDELRTITVRDYPENLATIEDALKRLDVQGAVQADVDLVIHVLAATKGEGMSPDLPADVKTAVAALRGTLAYKGYQLLTTFTQRVKDGTRGVRGAGATLLEGAADPKKAQMQMEFAIAQVTLASAPSGPSASGPAVVKLEGFKFEAWGDGKAQMQTDVSLKEGEQVVVGTSVFRDRGLVLLVSAKVAR